MSCLKSLPVFFHFEMTRELDEQLSISDYLRFNKTSQLTRSLSAMLITDSNSDIYRTANLQIEVLSVLFLQSSSPNFNVGSFTSKHTVTDIMSVHGPVLTNDCPPPILDPQNRLVRIRVIALVRPFPGDAIKEFTTSDSGNRDSG